ncbi:MAG: hypothetical protein KAU12_03670 [Candidatus Omnitrophica bacterium]|nr:hypothetical protein [Candidatus Omnitrophota bacterium]
MIKEYGRGYYRENHRRYAGVVCVDGSRLYIEGEKSTAGTYVPLEKIVKVRAVSGGVEITARLAATNVLRVIISLPSRALRVLIKDIVGTLHLKKRFLRREWSGEAAWR